jgi:hypothetical protein
MDLRKFFSTDKRAETEGRKMYLNAEKTVYLLVARKGNNNYRAKLNALLQENQTILNAKTPEAEAIATRCFKEAAAHGILIGWSKGIDIGDRKDVPYSFEAAMELFEMDDFYNTVDTWANDIANFRHEEVKQDAKN